MYVPSHTITITDKGSICELGEEDSRQFQEVDSIEIQLDNINYSKHSSPFCIAS